MNIRQNIPEESGIQKPVFLPPRPLRLQPGHLKRALVQGKLVGVLSAGFFGVAALFGGQILGIRHEQAVFANGVPAIASSVTGYTADVTSGFVARTPVPGRDSGGGLWPDYVLKVEYTDAQGAGHRHDLEFFTPLGSVDQSAKILVRYDREHPEDYALSWAVAASGNRMVGVVFEIMIFGLLGVATLWGAYNIIHHGYDACRAAEDGEEVELQILSATDEIVENRPTGNVLYRYLVPGEPETKARKESLNKKESPLILDEGNRFMLGLRSLRNGGRILLVKHDLSPFVFTADEEKAVRDRLAVRRAAVSD
jgi:hypothetical protein